MQINVGILLFNLLNILNSEYKTGIQQKEKKKWFFFIAKLVIIFVVYINIIYLLKYCHLI